MSDSLWKVKDLTDYSRKLESNLPPLYDFEQVHPVHREIEALILEYWEILHPLITDFITSWYLNWSKVKDENRDLNLKIDQQASILSNYQESSEKKIKETEDEIDNKKTKLDQVLEKIQNNELKLQKLEEMDKEKQLGISYLRSELEKDLAELNLTISEMQTRFEATQAQVIQSFQHKMLDFESEVVSLKKRVNNQDANIQKLQTENEALWGQNNQLKGFEEKILEIIEKLQGLSFIETEE